MAETGSLVLERARHLLEAVVDPEIPVVTIAGLGILRGLAQAADGSLQVAITPTYSGCPAVDQIEDDIRVALAPLGLPVQVRRQLSPAWTTDWITPQARESMRAYGIAPPLERHDIPPAAMNSEAACGRPVFLKPQKAQQNISCPRCASTQVTEISHFASTACKSLWRCLACMEPFDHFKAH
jgi:ring-1,2-phenylacetyl-CoA epoxidase subunit PaaD